MPRTRSDSQCESGGPVERQWIVWRDQPDDAHTRAFIHYCKRRGDRVVVVQAERGNVHVALKRRLR